MSKLREKKYSSHGILSRLSQHCKASEPEKICKGKPVPLDSPTP